ncbi:MAG: 16S rRNA (guanine(966)-N(2))-methyltransferase RsmD [Gammaproteobacteria bacterium]
MRIIAGEWRSRKIDFAAVDGLRPTPDRVRETLFNWLQLRISGARCLDVFAGSGILGLEAVSRGAASALLMEKDARACSAIAAAIQSLGAAQVELRRGDAIEMLATPSKEPYDIVFVDPPFRQGLVAVTLERLESQAWVAPGSRIYIEMERERTFAEFPADWFLLKSRTAGDVAYYLLEKQK